MNLIETLAHPNVAMAYEVGEYDGQLFIVLEFLPGPDLQDHVRQVGPISSADSASFIRQAASGLRHAHERGLIHRDVKPANLVLDGKRMNQSVTVHESTSLSMAVGMINGPTEIDLVLSDLNLPDSYGTKTVKRLIESCGGIPLIVLTGVEDPGLFQECLDLGADAAVSKNDLTAAELERLIFITQSRATRRSLPDPA